MLVKFLFAIVFAAYICCYASASTRIVGGQTADNGQFPFIASLRNNNKHFCGGSIITPRTIVTAAHCNMYSILTTTAVVGTNNLTSGGVSHKLSSFKNHEHYSTTSFTSDIAVIILFSEITYTSLVQPIALATIDNIGGNNDLIVAGWGYTSINYPENAPTYLQFLDTRSITLQECTNLIGQSVVYSKICTLTVGQGTCSGDAGGPLISNNTLAGVSSIDYRCASGKPDMFTRVHSFIDWINSNKV